MARSDLASRARDRWEAFVLSLPALDLMPETHRRYHAHTARLAAAEHARAMQREQYQKAIEAARQAREMALGRPANYRHPANGIRYSLEDRWAVFGMTGSGKTVLTTELASTLARMFPQAGVNVLDSKGDSSFTHDPEMLLQDTPPAPALPGERIVWRPPTDDLAAYDSWCESLLHSEWPAVVLIDELANLGRTSGGASFVRGYHLLLKQGRDGKKCVISCTQEAAFIPRNTTGQTTHVIRMHLNQPSDEQRLDRLIHGEPTRRPPEHQYGFWYKRVVGTDAPIQFRDWREMLGVPSD